MRSPVRQAGYTLLVMLLALMSLGGIVAAGFTQQVRVEVEQQKHLHNQRVLNEAKQALLYYAHNYAEISGGAQGPGRLPCADIDNDGESETLIGQCIQLGRLPWAEPALGLYDLRDASGERLWYAVSENFAAVVAGGNTVNSDSDGSITLRDRSGNLLVDGSIAAAIDGRATGIAAIVIAPGAPIERNNGNIQDRSVANGDDPYDYTPDPGNDDDEDTDPGIIDPTRYLDEFFAIEDNAAFVQGGLDGFIGGPIDDRAADTLRVNDQIVVITAAEVVAHAERAVLETYRRALLDYDQRQDLLAGGDYYPWLYDYAVYNYGEAPTFDDPELDDYPADANFANEPLGRSGRVPSMFARYFTQSTSQPIESRLRFSLSLGFAPTVSFDQGGDETCPQDYTGPDCQFGTLQFAPFAWSFSQILVNPLTNLHFDGGDLKGTPTANESYNFFTSLWFWDDWATPTGTFQLCPGVTDDPSDCDRDENGVPLAQNPDGNETASQVLNVEIDADYILVNGTEITYELEYAAPPTRQVDAVVGPANHARIEGTYSGDNVTSVPIQIDVQYEYDSYYLAGFNVQSDGTFEEGDMIGNGSLSLIFRFYPELPDWTFDDGWHDGIMMSYAPDYLPGGGPGPCTPGIDCLTVNNYRGPDNDKAALLVLAAAHDWDDEGADNLSDDLGDIFDFENATPLDDVFDASPRPGSDDRLLVMEVWP